MKALDPFEIINGEPRWKIRARVRKRYRSNVKFREQMKTNARAQKARQKLDRQRLVECAACHRRFLTGRKQQRYCSRRVCRNARQAVNGKRYRLRHPARVKAMVLGWQLTNKPHITRYARIAHRTKVLRRDPVRLAERMAESKLAQLGRLLDQYANETEE